MKPKVWVTGPVVERELEALREIADVELRHEVAKPSEAEMAERARELSIIIPVLGAPITARVLEAGRGSLRGIANFAVGFDNIDIPAATAAGIPVSNTPDVLVDATADIAFGLIIAAGRRFGDAIEARENRWAWAQALLLGSEVSGATLGILGLGRIGTAVARRAQGFGMRVIYYSRQRKPEVEFALGCRPVSFEELLAESDFLSLHCALTPDTRHILNSEALSRMKSTAVVVNTGRGGLIDQAALIEAVKSGKLAGAGLDVTDPEPPAADDPILHTPGIFVLPHIGSASWVARAGMTRVAARNAIAMLQGERPPNCLNPEVLGR